MQALKRRHPDAEFRGIGGPRMLAEGMQSLYPLETLSVMGLVEVLKHLPGLIKVRRHLRRDALAWQPDVMIGIDAPDFNLGLERQLRAESSWTARDAERLRLQDPLVHVCLYFIAPHRLKHIDIAFMRALLLPRGCEPARREGCATHVS